MMDKDKLEKTIKGLQCCNTWSCAGLYEGYQPDYDACIECPFRCDPIDPEECHNKLLKDAISLLKTLEPKLITKDDFANADAWKTIPAWIEYNPKIDGAEPGWQIVDVDILSSPFTKAWTSRPTDEQRKATPWTS